MQETRQRPSNTLHKVVWNDIGLESDNELWHRLELSGEVVLTKTIISSWKKNLLSICNT